MKKLFPFLFLLFVCLAHAQDDLPDIGKVSDITGKTKFYLVAEGEYRKAVIKAVGKNLIATDRVSDAEFFIQYKTLSRDLVGQTNMNLENGQLDVYIYREKRKIIVWSDSAWSGAFNGGSVNKLVKRFLQARKRIST